MIAHDTVNQSFPVCSDLAAVGKHLPSGLLYRQNQDWGQRRKRIDDYADTRIRSPHVSHRDRGGRSKSQWRRGWRHDGRHRNELGDTSGQEESLSLEQDMARDSSVKRGNVAAMIAWQRSSQASRERSGRAPSRVAGDVVSLGIFPVNSAAATRILRQTRDYS